MTRHYTHVGGLGLRPRKLRTHRSKHLVLGAGIAMTHARELKAMGLAPEKESAIESTDRVAAAAELRRMMEEDLARQITQFEATSLTDHDQ